MQATGQNTNLLKQKGRKQNVKTINLYIVYEFAFTLYGNIKMIASNKLQQKFYLILLVKMIRAVYITVKKLLYSQQPTEQCPSRRISERKRKITLVLRGNFKLEKKRPKQYNNNCCFTKNLLSATCSTTCFTFIGLFASHNTPPKQILSAPFQNQKNCISGTFPEITASMQPRILTCVMAEVT